MRYNSFLSTPAQRAQQAQRKARPRPVIGLRHFAHNSMRSLQPWQYTCPQRSSRVSLGADAQMSHSLASACASCRASCTRRSSSSCRSWAALASTFLSNASSCADERLLHAQQVEWSSAKYQAAGTRQSQSKHAQPVNCRAGKLALIHQAHTSPAHHDHPLLLPVLFFQLPSIVPCCPPFTQPTPHTCT